MVRSELIRKVANDNPHFPQQTVVQTIDAIFDSIGGAVANERRVELRGFGAFFHKNRAPRKGRNPRTGDIVDVSEKHVMLFRASKTLLKRLNNPTQRIIK